MQQKRNLEHSHDFWHWFKNFRKMLNDEAPSDIPKGEWELILGNTEVLMKSAKEQCKGDPVLFFELCQTLPESLGYIDDRCRVFLKQFLETKVSLEMCKKVAGSEATSGQEGFHGHAHRFTPKFKYFPLYEERENLFMWKWNVKRLQTFRKNHPSIPTRWINNFDSRDS